ncbi:ABC transporter substrate-binding protein [Alkalicoccobacillus porphyridii]|uniref:Sugar ABC transporter substrate-binding protein n=1 Tax=Alkalicoccobacillus porphyridii TaxID=2597270 RepID=A0A554A184_9BACI|nr:sugar ABC transporter substrate-binding protein [Alkalicoccobacillus porphyridii]TSB47460.1 sugar ABC transporter substrate-binding protein [Alkalicoccobacillus porphyridii]
MKKWGVSVAALFVVAGCSSSGGADTNANGDEQIELTFSTWGNENHIAVYEELLDVYYEDNPHVNVTIQTTPFPDYQQNTTVLAAGRELPDIGWAAERMVPQFIENGILQDISALKDDPAFEFDDILPGTITQYEEGDSLYGIPFSSPPHIIYYNKTLFEENDLPTPQELEASGEWTWEVFEESAAIIAEEEGVYGANFFRAWETWENLLAHTRAEGGDLFNEDMTEFTWNSEAGISTFDMLKRMMFEDMSHPRAGDQVAFEAGNIGMFFDVYSYVSTARGIDDFEWDIAPVPLGSQGRSPILGQAGYVMFDGSEYPEEALDLIRFFASQEGMEATSTYFAPPRTSVLESDAFIEQPGNPPRESIETTILDLSEESRVLPIHPEWQNIDNHILQGFDQLFGQTKDTDEILQQMEDNINPLVEQ